VYSPPWRCVSLSFYLFRRAGASDSGRIGGCVQPGATKAVEGANSFALFPVNCRRCPIGCASGQPFAGRLPVVITEFRAVGANRRGGWEADRDWQRHCKFAG
jgi:hypothetical protein